MSGADRRAMLVSRHLLTGAAPDPVAVTRALVALHSTDPASVFLSAAARGGALGPMETALYDERSLVRMLAMRRTVFVVPADFAPVVHAATTRAIAARERGRLITFVEQAGLTQQGGVLLSRLEDAALTVLSRRGEAFGSEIGEAVPGMRKKITIGTGGATQSLTSRVLFILAAEGKIVRGRPKGSWISSQYRWAPAARLPLTPDELPTVAAQIELAHAYLRRYGPATKADVAWWTGWTAGETKRALAAVPTVAVDLDGTPALVLEDDTAAGGSVGSATGDQASARLLPALDPTIMGWTGRDFFLDPDHRQPAAAGSLFDRSGNPGPTVWVDGRIVGGWAQRPNGEIAVRLLADVGSEAAGNVESEAARMAEIIGSVRVTPRFRTPLERSLAS